MFKFYYLLLLKMYYCRFEIYPYYFATTRFSGTKEFIKQAIVRDYSRTTHNTHLCQ